MRGVSGESVQTKSRIPVRAACEIAVARHMIPPLLIAAAMVVATSCGLPRDADGTLERVTGGVMRVGMVVDTPWVTDSAGGAGGVEGTLVYVIADELDARIEWHHGGESRLLERLHRRELDLVIAGLTSDSPWARKVALTRPYRRDTDGKEHVVAVAPGENAFLVRIERILHQHRSRFR
jgi:polar amino acid transport system substrate-binding protein